MVVVDFTCGLVARGCDLHDASKNKAEEVVREEAVGSGEEGEGNWMTEGDGVGKREKGWKWCKSGDAKRECYINGGKR